MKDFWGKYSEIIIIVGIIIVAVVLIFFFGKGKGKKWAPDEVKLPPDTQSGSGDFNPGPYTDDVKKEIYAWGFRDSTPLEKINALSNSAFVAVYNDWNKRYFTKDNETLVQAVEKESSLWNYAWDSAKLTFKTRAAQLNLV